MFRYLVEDFGLLFLRIISDNDSPMFLWTLKPVSDNSLKTVIQGQDGSYKMVSFPETICLTFYSHRDLPIEVAYHQVIVQVPSPLMYPLLQYLCAYKQLIFVCFNIDLDSPKSQSLQMIGLS